MNIFQVTAAPYVLTLLVSVLAWQLNAISNEITSANAASYGISVDAKSKTVSLNVQNLSRKHTLRDIKFSIVCRKEGACFGPADPALSGSDLAHIVAHAPVAPTETVFVRRAADEITVQSTLPAGSKVEIVSKFIAENPDFIFYYLPDSENKIELYVLRQSSIFGRFISNYLNIILISTAFIAFFILLWMVCSVAIWVFSLFRKSKKEGLHEAGIYRVVLTGDAVEFPGSSATGSNRVQNKDNGESGFQI